MRTDPTDTGGLFVGRRPGTAPTRYRATPEELGARRRLVDGLLAHANLVAMILVNLLFWGPLPALGLWVASQGQYRTDSVGLGILLGFAFLLAALFGGLAVLKRHGSRLDPGAPRRRPRPARAACSGASSRRRRPSAPSRFTVWLIFIGGLGSSVLPR